MSPARTGGKAALKGLYDKLLLIAVLALLLLSCLFLLIRLQMSKGRLSDTEALLTVTSPAPARPMDTVAFAQQWAALQTGVGELPGVRGFLASEARVTCVNPACGRPIPYEALVCPFCKAEQPPLPADPDAVDTDGDGIPDIWEEAHGMDVYNPADALMDPDQDRFSNREEYYSDTDPLDQSSRPPVAAKLRASRIWQEELDFTFFGEAQFAADQLVFQLNSRSAGRSFFLQIGEEIEGYGYTVSKYLADAPEGPTLVLTRNEREYSLVKDKEFTAGDWRASLISLLDGARFRNLKIDTRFRMQGQEYIVVDINADTVVIRNETTGNDLPVGPITPAEYGLLSRGRGR